jgi:acetylglutamate kinase
MALSGVANKELVSSLSAKGIEAVGVSGEDASLLVASALDARVLGKVGRVVEVNDVLLHTLLGAGYLPVISPVSCDGESKQGGALNVNADDAAAAIAASIGAEELLLISDVPGVIVGGFAAATLSAGEAEWAVESGTATDGMATKLRAALDALRRGVPQVRIGELDALLDPTLGTTVVAAAQVA